MAGEKSPVFQKLVECPICHNLTNNFVLKSKIVIPEKIGSDNHVEVYRWIDKAYATCNPDYYALWICHTCGFAAFPEQFEHLAQDSTAVSQKTRDAILQAASCKNGVIFKLLEPVQAAGDTIAFEQSLNMHFLAIYCQDMLYADNPDYEGVGRLYLRTAWLFREGASTGRFTRPFGVYENYMAYLKDIAGEWQDMPLSEEAHMEKAASFFYRIVSQDFTFEEAIKNIRFVLLSAELYCRLGNFQMAYDIVHSIVKLGYDVRRDIRNRLNEKKQQKKLMPKDERLAAHRIDRISDELRGVHDKYTEIKKAWLARYADAIEGVLRDNTDKYADALLACLAARHVPKDLISIVAREDERFQLAAPKKSIWRFWQKKP